MANYAHADLLCDAVLQCFDDMAGNFCVCALTKAHLRVAIEPFLIDVSMADHPEFTLEAACIVIEECKY